MGAVIGVLLVLDPHPELAAAVGGEPAAQQPPVDVGLLEGVGGVDAGQPAAALDEVVQALLLLRVGEVAARSVEQHHVVLLDALGLQVVELLAQGDLEVARLLEHLRDRRRGSPSSRGRARPRARP